MTITMPYDAYWDLMREAHETGHNSSSADEFDVIYKYPLSLGQGSWRELELGDGLYLAIYDYQVHEHTIVSIPECEHPLEYDFCISGSYCSEGTIFNMGQYGFCGSGVAKTEIFQIVEQKQVKNINLHMAPEIFRALIGECGELPGELQHLIKQPIYEYYQRSGATTPAMQIVLQQILHCPYQGAVKRVYLHSKVMELMALLLEQEAEVKTGEAKVFSLKRDDIERIHYAREILLQNLDNPPSLINLALQVGLNDYSLKRGFRQVFGQTVFGYLHDYRLKQAQQILLAGEMKVTEVAQAVGFGDRSYFAASFRKKFGMNPKQYLKACKQSLGQHLELK